MKYEGSILFKEEYKLFYGDGYYDYLVEMEEMYREMGYPCAMVCLPSPFYLTYGVDTG